MNERLAESAPEQMSLHRLLQEYTTKLRDICDAKLQASFRALVTASTGMGLVTVVAILLLLLGFTMLREPGPFSPISMAVVSVFLGLLGVISYLVGVVRPRFSRHRLSFDADQVAATVRKLVKLCSQYSEHSSRQIAEKFEFDLRIAEAEAALRLYYEVFGKPAPVHEEDELGEKPGASHGGGPRGLQKWCLDPESNPMVGHWEHGWTPHSRQNESTEDALITPDCKYLRNGKYDFDVAYVTVDTRTGGVTFHKVRASDGSLHATEALQMMSSDELLGFSSQGTRVRYTRKGD